MLGNPPIGQWPPYRTGETMRKSHPTLTEDEVMRQRVLVSLLAVGVLAAPAAPAAAQGTPSCVGQFASTFAREDGAAFGADISFGARFASQPNFGAGVVAPFAHEPRDACF